MNWVDLVGKTISSITQMKLREYDDMGFLKLEFTDGTFCFIIGGYGGYTGGSEDEYQTVINLEEDPKEDLVPLGK